MKYAVLLLLLSGFAFAANSDPMPPPPAPIIDFGPIISALANLPNQIVTNFFSFTITGLASTANTLTDESFKFLFASPDPNWFCASFNGVMAVLQSLFTLVLMGLALFYVIRSNDVEGRLTAKKWMENMLIMIIVLSFSFQLFKMLVDFNSYLSSSLASQSTKDLFHTDQNPAITIFSLVMLTASVSFSLMTFLTLLTRYILIPFLLLLFPVSIFLYFIPPTQNWGRTFLTIIIIFVFMTTADALVMMGLSAMFGSSDPNLADSLVRSISFIFGFAAIGFVNLALIVMALLSIVMQSKAITGVAGFTLLRAAVAAV